MLGKPVKPIHIIKDLQDLNAKYEHIVNEQWLIIDQRNEQKRTLEAFVKQLSDEYNEIIGKLTGGKCDRWSHPSDIVTVNEQHIAAKYSATRHVAIPAPSPSVWNGPSLGSSGHNGGTLVQTLPTGQSTAAISGSTGGTPAPGATGYIQVSGPVIGHGGHEIDISQSIDTSVASPMKVSTNVNLGYAEPEWRDDDLVQGLQWAPGWGSNVLTRQKPRG